MSKKILSKGVRLRNANFKKKSDKYLERAIKRAKLKDEEQKPV